MKKLILLLMIGCFFIGCATVTPSMLRPPENSISNKIKPLKIGLEGENVIRSESTKTVTVQTHFATIFSRTIEQNINESSRDTWGYIDARIVLPALGKPARKNIFLLRDSFIFFDIQRQLLLLYIFL